MVLADVLEKEVQHIVGLILGELIDAAGESLVDKETLPSGDGVGANDGVNSNQVEARVLRSATVGS